MALLTGWLTRLRVGRIASRTAGRVLDVGCGYGDLVPFLPAAVTSLDFVDSSPLRKERALARARERGIPARFFLCDANGAQPGFPEGPYEAIVLGALLEHLRPPLHVLRNLRPLLAPGGRLILTTPTPLGGALHRWGSYAGLTHPEAAHEHFAFYGRRDIEALLVESGYATEEFVTFLLGLNQLAVARPA